MVTGRERGSRMSTADIKLMQNVMAAGRQLSRAPTLISPATAEAIEEITEKTVGNAIAAEATWRKDEIKAEVAKQVPVEVMAEVGKQLPAAVTKEVGKLKLK